MNFRVLSFLGFLGCAAGLAFALGYLQYVRGYEPCPMCVLQRVSMLGAGLFFLLGALHGPKAWGQWIYMGLAAASAATGIGIAARHVWLQSLPPDQVPACGPTMDYLLEVFPWSEVVTMVLKGDGNCAKIDAQWLGLSLPFWTLLSFTALALYAVLTVLLPRWRQRSRFYM